MPFFIRNKNAVKGKFNGSDSHNSKRKRKNDNIEIDSDSDEVEGNNEAEDNSTDDEHKYETPKEKKLRLAKIYLEEIAKVEEERKDREEFNSVEDVISQKLKEDYLKARCHLQRLIADEIKSANITGSKILKCKEQDSVTCLALSSDNNRLYSACKNGSIILWCLKTHSKLKSIHFKQTAKDKKSSKDKSYPITTMALSTDDKFLAVGEGNDVVIRSPVTLELINSLKSHRDRVTGLVFRANTHQLYSAGADRAVKVWSLDEMAYVETLFGHQSQITAIDASVRETTITAGGRDCTLRVWKIPEDSQLIYNGHSGSIDCVKLINDEHFISGGDDGCLSVWSSMKKKPLCVASKAHGIDEINSAPNWIISVATLLNTDLVSSGSKDGFIRLWKYGNSFRSINMKFKIPVDGFVNSMVFTSNGEYLIAGIGQEHKLGRWWTNKKAKNSVIVIPLLKE